MQLVEPFGLLEGVIVGSGAIGEPAPLQSEASSEVYSVDGTS